LIFTPPKHILLTDRRTGYWLYRKELDRSGDEERAVAAAGYCYRFFGIMVVGFGMLLLVVGLIDLFSGNARP